MPFQFSLEKVLNYRRQLEEQAKLELARINKLHREQAKIVQSLEQKLKEFMVKLTEFTSSDEGNMWLVRCYQKRLKDDMEEESRKLRLLAGELEAARKKVIERSKEKKLLEKLKTKQLLEYQETEKNKEQKQFDEMATIRFQHKTF